MTQIDTDKSEFEMTETLIRNALPKPYAGEIEADQDLRADLGADELTIHTVALDLGDMIGREIHEDEYSSWATVGDVLAVVKRAEALSELALMDSALM